MAPFIPSWNTVAFIVWRMFNADKIWTDTGRTTLANVGDVVAAFQCTHSNVIATLTAGAGATLVDDGDGHLSLLHNADAVYTFVQPMSMGTQCTVAFRVEPGNIGMQGLFDSAPSNGNVIRQNASVFGNTNNWEWHPHNPDAGFASSSLVYTLQTVVCINPGGTARSLDLYQDGVYLGNTVGSGDSSPAWANPAIGGINGSAQFIGKWSGCIIQNVAADAGRVDELETYLEYLESDPLVFSYLPFLFAPIVTDMVNAGTVFQNDSYGVTANYDTAPVRSFKCPYTGKGWKAVNGNPSVVPSLVDLGGGQWGIRISNSGGSSFFQSDGGDSETYNAHNDFSIYLTAVPDDANMIGLFDGAPGQPNVVRNNGNHQWEWWDSDPIFDLDAYTPLDLNLFTFLHTTDGVTGRSVDYRLNSTFINTYTDASTANTVWSGMTFGNLNHSGSYQFNGIFVGCAVFRGKHDSDTVDLVEYHMGFGSAPPTPTVYYPSFDDLYDLTDDAVQAYSTSPQIFEARTITDQFLIRKSQAVSFVDTLTFSDAAIGYINRIFTDSLSFDDVISGLTVKRFSDGLTYTSLFDVSTTLQRPIADVYEMFDSIGLNHLTRLSVSDMVTFSDVMDGHVTQNFHDNLDFTDSITVDKVRPLADTLTLEDLMGLTRLAVIHFGDSLPITDLMEKTQTIHRNWIDELTRTEKWKGQRVRFGTFSDELDFNDSLIRDRISASFGDTVTYTDSLNLIRSIRGTLHDDRTFTDEMSANGLHGLQLVDSLNPVDDFYIYKTGSGIKIFGKSRSICLPSPEFNDYRSAQDKMIVPRVMDGGFRTYIKRTPNDKHHWQFFIQKPKKDEIEDFILNEINNTLIVHDWRGLRWQFNLVTDSFDFTELAKWAPGGNKFEVTLEFEGVPYYG